MTFQHRFDTLRAVKLNSEAEEKFYRIGRWFQGALLGDHQARAWCEKNGMETRRANNELVRAASEGLNVAGGFLVPHEIENTIIANRTVAGVFRREARNVPMAGDLMNTPRRSTGPTASFTAEGSTLTDSNMTWDSVGLTAKKLYSYTKISSELNEDAVGLGQYMVEEIGFAFADKEDACGFNGDGTSTYGGMTGITTALNTGTMAGKVTAATNNDTFVELTAADLGSLAGALPEQYLPNAKWYVSAFGLGNTFVRLGAQVYGQVDTPTGPRPLFAYNGFPVVATPKLPGSGDQSNAIMVLFGDLQRASTLGTNRGVTVRVSESFLFNTDQLAVVGTERFDLNNHGLGDATTAGAIVGLMGN